MVRLHTREAPSPARSSGRHTAGRRGQRSRDGRESPFRRVHGYGSRVLLSSPAPGPTVLARLAPVVTAALLVLPAWAGTGLARFSGERLVPGASEHPLTACPRTHPVPLPVTTDVAVEVPYLADVVA